jgi:hypothetical protein
VYEQYYNINIPVYTITDYKFFLARIHGNVLAPTAKFATIDMPSVRNIDPYELQKLLTFILLLHFSLVAFYRLAV